MYLYHSQQHVKPSPHSPQLTDWPEDESSQSSRQVVLGSGMNCHVKHIAQVSTTENKLKKYIFVLPLIVRWLCFIWRINLHSSHNDCTLCITANAVRSPQRRLIANFEHISMQTNSDTILIYFTKNVFFPMKPRMLSD